MDNLCHTLAGAVLGTSGLASRTRHGMLTLLVASNLPDIDVAVFATDTLPVSFRRGWTHGVLAQVALPVLLASVVWALGRQTAPARTRPHPPAPARTRPHPPAPARTRPHPPAPARTRPHPPAPARTRFAQLLLLSLIGVYAHVFMDWLNSYGVRLLMPFSERWFYGDALFIVDPWLYLVFGLGIVLASRAARRGTGDPTRPARAAAAIAALYMLAMVGSNLWARAAVREGLTRAGQPAGTRFMVTPVPVNPFRREVLVDTGDRYEKGFVWFEPAPHFRPAGYGVEKGLTAPDTAAALATPRARAYLNWSRFPFVVVDRSQSPPTLWLNDYRYSDASARLGWAGLSLKIDD